jgi:hypothetical protein
MGRPKKKGADWIPLDVNSGKTFFVLSQNWGNDGFAFWVQLLRLLGRENELCFRLDDTTKDYFLASVGVDEKICYDILNTLVRMGKIDSELWKKEQIIWCQGLADRLEPFYGRMGRKLPNKPTLEEFSANYLTGNPDNKELSGGKLPENNNNAEFSGKEVHNISKYNINKININTARDAREAAADKPPLIESSLPDDGSTDKPKNDDLAEVEPKPNIKNPLNKNQQERFDKFWAAYPIKKSIVYARKVWKQINPDDALLERMLAAIDMARKHDHQWLDGYIPNPSTWLNQGKWEDVIDKQERGVITANQKIGRTVYEYEHNVADKYD